MYDLQGALSQQKTRKSKKSAPKDKEDQNCKSYELHGARPKETKKLNVNPPDVDKLTTFDVSNE